MSAMKLKKRYRFLIALCVLGIAFTGWDWYMRNSWDNHIISRAPVYFHYVQEREGRPPSALSVEAKDLSDYYKAPIDIIKRGNNYYWRNHDNLRLKKSVRYTEIVKNSVSYPKGQEWILLSSEDDAVIIKIHGNNYLGFSEALDFGCYRPDWAGNAEIQYDLSQRQDHSISLRNKEEGVREYLATSTFVDVYENVFQYFYCK